MVYVKNQLTALANNRCSQTTKNTLRLCAMFSASVDIAVYDSGLWDPFPKICDRDLLVIIMSAFLLQRHPGQTLETHSRTHRSNAPSSMSQGSEWSTIQGCRQGHLNRRRSYLVLSFFGASILDILCILYRPVATLGGVFLGPQNPYFRPLDARRTRIFCTIVSRLQGADWPRALKNETRYKRC